MFKKLKDYILLKLGISELKHHQRFVEKRLNDRIDFLSTYLNITQGEDIHLDPQVMKDVSVSLCAKYSIKAINSVVHKNDVMLAFTLFKYRANPQQAVQHYFNLGIETAQRLHQIALNNKIEATEILDFGSGYGRVSRFLPSFFIDSKIEVSEVKTQALDFQKRHFGYNGIAHTQDVNSFPDKEFDLILALSVFTHLPQASFQNWLSKLISTLKHGGALVFTFNNSKDIQHAKLSGQKDFAYTESSEDSAFPFLYDSLQKTEDYGNTFVSRSFIENLLTGLDVKFQFLGNELVPSQEAIIVIKK